MCIQSHHSFCLASTWACLLQLCRQTTGVIRGLRGSVVWGAPTFSCWQYQRLKGHTKFRGGARFRHEGLHHGNRQPETQERWKSIQQTRSPWCSSVRDRASIARCKTVARYQEERQEGKDNKQTNKRKKMKKSMNVF